MSGIPASARAGTFPQLPFPPTGLPVEGILGQLASLLGETGAAVLQAEPGAGKTTLVPPALFRQAWLDGQKILMLQPRRVAARSAAERMAELLGEPVGRTVGYRVSLDSRVSAETRIEVLTEGILTRMIQEQPDLPGVGLVVFDEFHERSQHADLGLALALDVRQNLRPGLRLLVMSATIDAPALARLLGGPDGPAPVITCGGRSHPVSAAWRPPSPAADGQRPDFWRDSRRFLEFCAGRIREGLDAASGDILVFLPGQGEIRRVAGLLSGSLGAEKAAIVCLHGGLASDEQAAALRPGAGRRIILATNIAETSLTIPGISLVIDSGLVRVNRFDTRLAMDRLVTERVSQASSLQRQGRAGRTAQGLCWKLWPEEERLEPFLPPEIERADLADFVLNCLNWGLREPSALRLLSPPSPQLWDQAAGLLDTLGARDTEGGLSPHGRAMGSLGLHPRLAALILASRRLGPAAESLAWACAALLGERDVLAQSASGDFKLRLELLTGGPGTPAPAAAAANPAQLQRCREFWRRNAERPPTIPDGTPSAGLLLARAWPERIGRREGTATDRQRRLVASYQLASGRRALLEGPDAEHAPAWLVVPEAEAGDQATVIRLFAAIGEEAPFERQLADMVHEEFTIEWNQWRPLAKRLSLVGQLQLSSRPIPAAQLPARQLHDAFERHLHTLGAADGRPVLPWPESALALLSRVRWAHAVQPERWPDLGEAALAAARPAWLHPHLNTTGGPVLDPATLQAAIEAWLGWQARQALDQAVPSHFQVPSGSRRPLEYPAVPAGAAPPAPILAVRIQEVFGMASQPCILGVPIQLHLLSPAQRPLQVTADLASFWSRTYPEIRKEMRGRYPRHYWPDNPLEAEATARAKPRGS